mgnify:CR=1 FL=1
MKIYYFSGTGNGLVVARELAKRLDAEILSIPQAMKEDRIRTEEKKIVLVFPSYLAQVVGMPLILERFIEKLEGIGDLEIFGVCSCGGYESVNALPSLDRLERVLEKNGGKLRGAYSLRLPMNNLDYAHIPVPINKDSEEIIRKSRKVMEQIGRKIGEGRSTEYRGAKKAFLWMMKPLFQLIKTSVMQELRRKAQVPEDCEISCYELMPLTDRSMEVGEGCTGCGICEKVCPVGNIKLVDGRPKFQHRCEMCFACDEWCPTDSIHHWCRGRGIKYHHPEVCLADSLKRP